MAGEAAAHAETAMSQKRGHPHGRGAGRGAAPHSHALLSLSQEAKGTLGAGCEPETAMARAQASHRIRPCT